MVIRFRDLKAQLSTQTVINRSNGVVRDGHRREVARSTAGQRGISKTGQSQQRDFSTWVFGTGDEINQSAAAAGGARAERRVLGGTDGDTVMP